MTSIILLHEEALGEFHPIYQEAGEDTTVIYVWDDEYLQSQNYGFKRLVFIYESLCTLGNVTIYRGKTEDVVSSLIQEKKIKSIYIPETNIDNILNFINMINGKINVIYIPSDPLVILKKQPDLGRFFRYWKVAERTALRIKAGRRSTH